MKRIIVWITVLSLIIAGVFAMNACNRRTDASGASYEVNTPARDELSRVIITYGEQTEDYLSRITVTKIENGVSTTVPVEPSMLVTAIDTSVVDGSGQILQFTYSGQMFSIPVVVKYKVEFVANGTAYRTYHVHNKAGLDNIKSILEEEARAASGLGDQFNPGKLKLHELLAAPQKAGYNFVGWSFDDPATSENAKIENSFMLVINGNVTYNAVYEPEMSEIPALSVIDAIYGENLADVKLPSSKLGQWQFKNAEGTVGKVGENTFEVQFVESATGNVLAESTVVINVVKQDAPELPELPVIEAVYGDLLADIVLPSFEVGAWQFENAEGTVGNAGENTFVVQFVDAQTNEVLEARTITVVVAKKTVNFLNVVESFSYNGEVQIPTFQTDAPELDVTHIQFNSNEACNYTDAGTYGYSFVIVDDNYEGTLEGTYEILPVVISVVIQVEKDSISVGQAMPAITYDVVNDGGMSVEELASLISIVEPEIDGVGEYTVTATTSNPNVELVVTPATLTVSLGKLNVGAPTFVNGTTSYGETLSTVVFEDHPHGWWEWANPADLVGDVIPAEDWEGHLAIFTPIASGKYAKEYYYVKNLNVQPKKLDIVIDKSDDIGGIAGTITVDYAPGTAWSVLYNIVEKGTNNAYADSVLRVYYTYAEVNFDTISFENAGKYIVTLNLEGGSNYEKVTASVILDIRKIDPNFEVETTLTETWKPELTLGQIALPTAPNGQFVWGNWLNGEEDTAAAGEFLNANDDFYFRSATFIPNDEVNYNRVVVTFQVKVNKAIPEIEGINNSYEFIYNGGVHTVSSATVNPDKYVDTPVFVYTNKADGTPFGVTEAGTYTLVVTLLESESGNYESAQIEVTVTVVKADPQKPIQLQSAVYGDLLLEKVVLPEHAEGVWSFVGADATTTVGAVGQNVFVAIFTPTTGNYNSIEVPITVEVAKKYISVPKISDSNKTQVYTGALLTSGLTSAEGYTVTDLGGINVGTYKVQIVLDTASYEWSSFGTAATFELEYNIVRADNAWTVEPTIKSAWTYGDTDGLSASALAEYKGIASAFYGDVVVLYAPYGTDAFSNVFPTAAGKYTVKFIVTDSNYNDLVRTIDFTINKKVVTVPAYTNTYIYTGGDIEVNIPMSDLYTVVGNSAKNAGKYVATLTLKDSANYAWSTSELDTVALAYEIRTSGVALTVTINGWTYGQAANLPTVTVNKTFSDEVSYIVEYSADGAAWSTSVPTEAGTYTVRAKVEDTDNYKGAAATYNFTITKANVTIEGVDASYSKDYDGAKFDVPGATASNSATVKAAITKDGKTVEAIVGAGEYIITYSVAESANYFAVTKTITVTVNKADVTISKPVINGWIYGETAKAPGAGFVENFAQISNGEITFKYFTDAACTEEITDLVNAGTYYVKAIFAGNKDLNAAESEATEFVIAQLEVKIPTVSNKAYNGQNQTAGLENTTAYTVVDLGGINVGTYKAVVELVNDNYIWADGTSEAKELDYKITPIANTEVFERTEYTATYGDLLKDIITLPAGVQGTWSIKDANAATTVGNADVNTFKAIFTPDEVGNYVEREVTITITVAKATVNVPTEYTINYVYTGSNITAVIPTSTLYAITNNVAKNVGNYNAILTLTDSTNYKWNTTDAATITVPYSITKASLTASVTLGGWTYGQAANVPTVNVNKAFEGDVDVYFEYSVDGAAWSKTVPTEAGNYQVRVIVEDDNNYFGYTSEAYSFNIAKATAYINGVNAGDVLTQVYNGNAYVFSSNIKASHNESALQFAITNNGVAVDAIVNAGEYTVVITLPESANYNSASVEFTVAIAKAETTDEVSTAQNATYGDDISAIVLPTSTIGTWSIKEAVTTVGNAGVNTFTALFKPSTENYNSREVTITVTVAKKVVDKPIINPQEYTGEHLYSGLVDNELYTVVDNGGIDHGEYDVVLTLVDPNNYKWDTSDEASITVKFVISTAINKWVEAPSISGWEYESAGDHAGKATAMHGGVLVEYKPAGAPDSEYSTTLPTVPGDYVARFTTTDDNYIILSETKNFSIIKRKITPPTQAQTSFIYTGSLITSGLSDGIGYAVVADEGRTNVGSFTATVTLTSEYYVWADGTSADKTFTYSITPATNTEEITLAYNAIYGDLVKAVIELPAGVQGTWRIENVTDATTVGNVGTRTFKVVFTPDEVGNYNDREETITIIVAKATVTPPVVTKQEGIEYTGDKVSSGVLSTDLYTAADIGGIVVGTHRVKLTLVDKENYKWIDGDSDDIYFDYVTIVKSQNRDEIPTYTATYGDSLATLTLPTSATGSWKWQTITEVGNVGEENKHVLVFTPADSANYADKTVEVSITVTPKKISVPAISATKLNQVYTGETLVSGLTNGEGYTVVDNGGINVGSYKAVVSLANANYIWTDGTSAAVELTYNITPATNTEDITKSFTATYGDLLKDIITLPEGVQGTWSIEGMTDATVVGNAGTRTFKAIFTPDANGNYFARDVEITVTVGKKEVTAPTEYTKEYTYTGGNITAVIPSSDLYTVTNNTAKNAGGYNATLTLTDSANYKWATTDAATVTVPYSIAKATVTLSNLTIVGWTYGQSANAPEVIVTKDFADTVTVSFEYLVNGTWVETAPVGAGTYTIKAEVAGTTNYEGDEITAEFTVAKASVVINGADDSYTTIYNGNAFAITGITASNGATVDKVITKGGEVVDAIIGVGEYVVTYSVAESANYQAAIKQVSVTVNKANVTISDPTIEGWTYSEAAKTPSASFNEEFAKDSNGEIIFKYYTDAECTNEIINLDGINAGTYYVKAVFAGNDNLNAVESAATSFVIAKKAIAVPTVTDKVYNGKNQNAGISANEGYTVSDNGGTNVGSYTVVVALVNANNYEWADGTTVNKELTYSITKASVSFEDLAIAGWVSGKYDATANQPTVIVDKDFDGDVAVSFEYYVNGAWGTALPTLAGDYAVRAIVAGTANYDGAVSIGTNFKVTKAEVTLPSIDAEYPYTGNAQKPTIAESIYYTIVGNDAHTAMGEYTITIKPTGTYSFVWAGETTEPGEKTLTYKIGKGIVTLSGLTINNWGYNETANVPSVTINKTFSEDVTVRYEYFALDGTSLGTTAPTAVGTYKVKAIVDGTDNYTGYSVEKEFSIVPAKATLSTPTFTGGANGKYYMNNFGYSTAGLTATHAGQTVSGTFEFGTPVFVEGTNNSYIELTFTPNDTANYAVVTVKNYVTFVTVAVNNSTGVAYGSIESALKEAVSGNTVQVKAYDPDLGPIYIKENVTIASNVTFILPYGINGDGVNTIKSDGTIDVPSETQTTGQYAKPADETKCHVMVVLAAGVEMTNNGTLQIAGQLSAGSGAAWYSGFTAGEHARLVLDADAELINNGTIYAAGFIRELNKNNGSKVTLTNGSVLWQPFTVRDFPGGSVSYALYQTMGQKDTDEPITAFSRFILMNVSPETHINYGGSVKVWAMLWAGDKVNQTVGDMIGSTDINSSSVIVLTDKTYSKIISKFDVDTEVCDLDIYGGAKTNGMKLSIKVLTTVTINTIDALFAVSYHYDVSLNKAEGQAEAEFTMSQRFKIMTGAKFTVGEGVVLNATDIIVYEEFHDIRSDAGTGFVPDPNDSTKQIDHPMKYPEKDPAVFIVNGTLNINKLGGKVYSEVEGAKVNIKSAAIYTAYELDTSSGSSLTAKVDKKQSITEKAALVGATHTVSNINLNTAYTYENGEWVLYHVSFDSNGGSACDSMGIADAYLTLPTPVREGYEFLGWYYGDALISNNEAPKVASDHTLVAKWKSENEVWITVGLDSDGDGVADKQVQYNPAEGNVYPSLPTLTKDGYKFTGWTYNGTTVTAGSAVTATGDHMLTAQWAKLYTISVSTSNATVTGVTDGDKVAAGDSITISISYSQSNSKTVSVTNKSTGASLGGGSGKTSVTFTMPESDVTISASSEGSCIAAGTLVTLADGTQKKVEDLTMEDILLVFNHETGEYEPAGIIFIENDGWDYYNVITLTFSDGTTTKIIYEHALFDLTLNGYVYITEQNYADFIGHEFAMQGEDGFERVTMTDATLAVEYTGCFSLVTVYHLNYFIDGLFSIPGGISGLFNIFEYGDDLVYDAEKMQADIEKYGLFTYEDFEEFLPYEFYLAFPASYLKVSIGKGMMTFDHIYAYIEQFLVQNGLM